MNDIQHLFNGKQIAEIYEYGARLNSLAVRAAEAIKKFTKENGGGGAEIDDYNWFRVIFEYLYLLLHITDRQVYGETAEERRHSLLDILLVTAVDATVDSSLREWPDNMKEKVKEEALGNYNSAAAEFSQYKKLYTLEKDESPKDTLFWEFSKGITKLIEKDNDLVYIMLSLNLIIGCLKELGIVEFIEKIK